MLGRVPRRFACKLAKPQWNVTVIGAAGGIGQPLSLLLKLSDRISALNLFDIRNCPGVAADLSHISTPSKVSAFEGDDLAKALARSHVVVIPAGFPRKPGMTRDDLFTANANVVKNIAEAVAKHCPQAMVCLITNPVNSTVPVAAEILKKAGCYDPRRVFGVTTLDLVRSETFVAELTGVRTVVPVIGGHSGPTIVPVLSAVPGTKWTETEAAPLVKRIQYAGDEVVAAKAGTGSATLSMAYAAYRFTNQLLRAMDGEENVEEYAFVETNVDQTPYFATKLLLGKDGVAKAYPKPELSPFEQELYKACIAQLVKDIAKGVSFAKGN